MPNLSALFSADLPKKSDFKQNGLLTRAAGSAARDAPLSRWPPSAGGGEMDGATLALQAHLSRFLEEVDGALPPPHRPLSAVLSGNTASFLCFLCIMRQVHVRGDDRACVFYKLEQLFTSSKATADS